MMKRCVTCFVIACGISSSALAQTTINGDAMALQSSGSASGSAWDLSSDGYVGTYIQVPTAGSTVSFDLNAAGVSSQGVLPDVTLSVAGTNVPFTVTTASNGDYLANVTLPGDANATNPNGNGTYLVRLQLDNQSATATPTVNINSLSVTGATVLNSNTNALALDSAQTYADEFRAGPGTITLDNASGVHLGAGTSVQVKLISNAFNFVAAVYGNTTSDASWINVGSNGQNLAPVTTEQIDYQKALLANFNGIVPSNGGKWANNVSGSTLNPSMNLVDAMGQFASQNNLMMRMHNLIWNSQQPTTINNLFSGTPGTLTSANKATLNTDITNRIGYYVSANNPNTGKPLADSYEEMDVLNEPFHGEADQADYLNSNALGTAGVANVYSQVASAVAAAGANTRLYTNEYNVLQFSPKTITNGVESGSDPYANWYLNGVQGLQRAGAPIGGIGMELYVNSSNAVSPTQMQEAMGNLSVAKDPNGNPIALSLTEFGVANGQSPSAATYDADLTTALTMDYGNPQATTFGYWGGVGGPHYGTNSIYALYDQNYNLTSAGQTWQTFMNQIDTNDTLTTNANGQVSFNGTYGMYDVIVGGVTYTLDLEPGTTNYGLMTPISAGIWTGGGSGNNFSSAGNWGGTALAANAPLVFAGSNQTSPNNDTAANTEYAGITFNSGASAFVVGGNAINLAGDVINNSTNLQTVNLNLAMQANTNFNAASGNLAIGGNISGAFTLTKTGANTVTLSGTNTYSGGTTVSTGTLVIGANGALPANSAVAINGTSELQLAQGTGLATLSSLTIAPGAKLDITNNHIIINYTGNDPTATIAGYLGTGYAGGAWTGPGIDSSAVAGNTGYSIGYADGADGVVAGLAPGQVEIAYTLAGDANLDGLVNGDDFTILVGNLGKVVSGWDKGDFTYDGLVSGDDFTLLAGNLGKSANGADVSIPAADFAALDAFAAANGLMASVPEPGTISLLAIAGFGLISGRRRGSVASN